MNSEELEEKIIKLERKVNSKIGWIELLVAIFVFGIIIGLIIK